MSTAPPPNPYPAPYPPTTAQIFAPRAAAPATSRAARSASHALRRRATVDQGRALEKLGHAIEYLIDSRLYGRSGSPPLYDPDDREAEQLLAHLSRTVFADCREIAPPMQRLKTWLLKWLTTYRAV